MAQSHEPHSLSEDRPSLWPHPGVEPKLPAAIEHRLAQAMSLCWSQRDRAGELVDEAIGLARADGGASVVARTLYGAAALMRRLHRPDRAYSLCLEVLPMLERQDDRWRATQILLLRGQCCLDVGEHERAVELIDEAAGRFRRMDNPAGLARCQANLACARRLAGDLAGAIAHAELAVTTLDRHHSPVLDVRYRNNEAVLRIEHARQLQGRGDVLAGQAEYARAAALLPDVRTLALTRDEIDGGQVLDTHVQVAMATGDEETLAIALKSLAAWARREKPLDRGLVWHRLAQHAARRGRRRGAIACARRSARCVAGARTESRRVETLVLLADLLEEGGDARGAYEAYAEAVRVELQQQSETVTLRAQLLALDNAAEQALYRSEQTLAYAQRLSNVGHLVASVNHELNQPMASIRMLSETALALLEHGESAEALTLMRSMSTLATRLTGLTAQLATFPAAPQVQARPVSLRHAADEAIGMLRSRLAQTPCEITLDFTDVVVHAQEGRLVRVIANLVNNALDVLEAMPLRRIVFTCTADPDRVVLSVADNGPGLAPAVLERLFQPFFSTKAAGRGLGLGLALSRDVMREMGGDLAARHGESGGAVFDIVLPVPPRRRATDSSQI